MLNKDCVLTNSRVIGITDLGNCAFSDSLPNYEVIKIYGFYGNPAKTHGLQMADCMVYPACSMIRILRLLSCLNTHISNAGVLLGFAHEACGQVDGITKDSVL